MMAALFGVLPVILFLICLLLLDSFKLVRPLLLFLCLGYGLLTAVAAFYVNNLFINAGMGIDNLTRYVAPVTEEFFKFLLVVFLVYRHKVGFVIDAAICGFAIGAGFALVENAYYLQMEPALPVAVAIVRGLGTALMHGGTVSIGAMILAAAVQRETPPGRAVPAALLATIILHSAFNHFLLSPLLQTLMIILLLPLVFYLVLLRSTHHLQQWLEVAFSSEIGMLGMIRQGQFRNSRPGQYLLSLKNHFEPEALLDLYCFLGLYLELSIKAKRNLMLKENGFAVILEPGTKEKLNEFKQLKKQIGKAGELALMPLLRMRHRDLWQLNMLEN